MDEPPCVSTSVELLHRVPATPGQTSGFIGLSNNISSSKLRLHDIWRNRENINRLQSYIILTTIMLARLDAESPRRERKNFTENKKVGSSFSSSPPPPPPPPSSSPTFASASSASTASSSKSVGWGHSKGKPLCSQRLKMRLQDAPTSAVRCKGEILPQ